MVTIHDCSNQSCRPTHRGGGGPVQNDLMRYLKLYAHQYGAQFTEDPTKADVMLTNDCFPDYALNSGKRLIKRMDGVFSHPTLLVRNAPLNCAAQQADYVIFIAEYAKKTFQQWYPQLQLKSCSVAVNEISPEEFFPQNLTPPLPYKIITSVTDWNRTEKRWDALKQLALQFPQVEFHLIGTPPKDVIPNNCICHGYQKSYTDCRNLMQQCHGFIHLAWRDPAPKTVLQGLACGLPVFYADSGGNAELVGIYGFGTPDPDNGDPISIIPALPDPCEAFTSFLQALPQLRTKLRLRPHKQLFHATLESYFKVLC